MIFFKTITCGNSFIHINEAELKTGNFAREELVKKLCREKSCKGADGVVFYQPSPEITSFRIFNKNGKEAELSGNGMAGVSAVIFNSRPDRAEQIKLLTKAGLKTVTKLSHKNKIFRQRVEIGEPNFTNSAFFPFLKKDQDQYTYKTFSFYPVSVGNPHIVIQPSAPLTEEELIQSGSLLSTADLFPQFTNVEFVYQKAQNNFQVFFFERGVGKTLSSSTGSAAVYAVLKKLNKITDKLVIKNQHGRISIYGFPKIHIENITKIVYKGIY